MGRLYFEDLVAGETEPYGGYTVGDAEIEGFGRDFDPDFALVSPQADRSAASGWLVAGINMRMVCDAFVGNMASMGGPGLDSLEWLHPVRAGDRLTGRRTILDMRLSKSRPELGFVRFGVEVLNQRDECVMTQRHLVMVLRRGAEERPRDVAPRASAPADAGAARDKSLGHAPPPAFEALEVGMTFELGVAFFDQDSIIRFATAYDPQPFHVDEAAGRRSHFGGLVASGWHTATGWSRAAYAHDRRHYGATPPRRGPLLGLTELNWRKPVYVGDTISYAMRIEAKQPAKKPGWGVVETLNTGVDQTGASVFDFRGTMLWRREGVEP